MLLSHVGTDTKRTDKFYLKLDELIQELDKIEGIERYRISSIEPNLLSNDIIEFVAQSDKFMPHFHIPLQSGSNDLLKLMRRRYLRELYVDRVNKIKQVMPHACIGVDVIVGFPGETEEEFQDLLNFLEEAQLDRVGCFQYSPVTGAVANDIAEPVPDEIKQERYDRFMQLQQRISADKMQAKVGKVMKVLVDEIDDKGAVARSMADAPEIDGMVFIDDAFHLVPGQFVTVESNGADEYDLWAKPADEFIEQDSSYIELG